MGINYGVFYGFGLEKTFEDYGEMFDSYELCEDHNWKAISFRIVGDQTSGENPAIISFVKRFTKLDGELRDSDSFGVLYKYKDLGNFPELNEVEENELRLASKILKVEYEPQWLLATWVS